VTKPPVPETAAKPPVPTPFTLVSVTLGTEEESRKFVARHGLPAEATYDPVEWGAEGSTARQFGFQIIPHTVLVDAEGRIAATFSEEEVMAEAPVVAAIRKLQEAARAARETPGGK